MGQDSRYFKLYIRQLHELVRLQDEDDGFGDNDQIDQLMRRMDIVWYRLTPEEQERARI